MKRLLILTLILGINSLIAQTNTRIVFKELNQEFDFSEEKIKIELQVINSDQYKAVSNAPFALELFCTNVSDEKYFGITKNEGLPIILEHSDTSIEVEFKIDEKILKEHRSLTFIIRKKGINANFEVSNTGHTVVLLPKNYGKSEVSITKPKTLKKLTLNLNELESIKVPFNLNVKGYEITEADKVKAKISINGKNDKDFGLYGKSSKNEFLIKREDNKGSFDSLVQQIKKNENLVLKLKELSGNTKKDLTINKKSDSVIVEVKDTKKEKARYDFFLGTNFDLRDRFEATSFYSEISAFIPDIGKVSKIPVSIRGGLYKNNNSIDLEESRRQEVLLEIDNVTADSITYSTKRVNTVPKVDIENLGLYIELLFRVAETNDKRFKGYVSARFETIERREKYTFNSTDLFGLDRTTISLDSLSNNSSLQSLLTQPRDFTRKYYDTYYAVGVPMFYTAVNKDFEIYLNPMLGMGQPGLQLPNEDNTKDFKPFGVFQFHLIVSDGNVLGIKLGGEIRKYFNFEQNPLININLSTRINLSGALKKEAD